MVYNLHFYTKSQKYHTNVKRTIISLLLSKKSITIDFRFNKGIYYEKNYFIFELL